MHAFYACLIAILLISLQSCAQNTASKPDNPPNKKTFSAQDSTKLNHYYKKLETSSIFTYKGGLYLDSILSIDTENARLWQQRAMPLFKQKKYEIGMPYLDNAVKYDPKSWLDYRAFMKCIFSKNYSSAIEDFKAAEKQNGKSYVMDHPYDFYMGLCYLQLNKLEDAERLISQVIEEKRKAHPNDETWVHFLHLFYMGIVYMEKEEYQRAIDTFDKSLKQYSQFSDVKYYKSICLDYLGKKKEAFELLTEALEDVKKGYTINEDNAVYEIYPYQANEIYISRYLKSLTEQIAVAKK
jgi:tetratricopeptide (TPR) repeat protein